MRAMNTAGAAREPQRGGETMMEPYREQEREHKDEYERDERWGVPHAWLDQPVSDPVTFTMRDMLETIVRVRQKQAAASAALFYWSIWCGFWSVMVFAVFKASTELFTSVDPCVWTFVVAAWLIPYLLVRRFILKQIEPP
jgi:hypothetical protein